MWLAISVGKVCKLAVFFLLLGFTAGMLVGVRVNSVPPAPAYQAPLSAPAPRPQSASGEEVATWSPTVSRSRFSTWSSTS